MQDQNSFHSIAPLFIKMNNTRTRIIEAAEELYCRHGIRRITMDDIAEHLSVSKKTIYSFFKEKDDLVHTVCIKIMNERRAEFENIQKNSTDAINECLSCMKHVNAMFTRMNPGLFYDLQKFYPKTWKQFREFKEKQMIGLVANNLKAGISEGVFRQDISVPVLARLRMEEVELAMNPYAYPPEKYNLKDVQLALLDHFLYGIVTLKGHKLIEKYKKALPKKTEFEFA